MHRASSTGRFANEFYNNSPSSSSSSSSPSQTLRTTTSSSSSSTTVTDPDKLPTYNPDSHVAKKEKSRLRSAENAVHLIPLVLVLCAIILWFSSKPVDIVNKGDSNVPRIKGLTMDGNTASDGTQSSLLTNFELEDFDPESVAHLKPTRLLEEPI